jgi:hypothetical protein
MSFKPLQFTTRGETPADGTEPDPTAWPHSASCRSGFIVILDFFLATLQVSFMKRSPALLGVQPTLDKAKP